MSFDHGRVTFGTSEDHGETKEALTTNILHLQNKRCSFSLNIVSLNYPGYKILFKPIKFKELMQFCHCKAGVFTTDFQGDHQSNKKSTSARQCCGKGLQGWFSQSTGDSNSRDLSRINTIVASTTIMILPTSLRSFDYSFSDLQAAFLLTYQEKKVLPLGCFRPSKVTSGCPCNSFLLTE